MGGNPPVSVPSSVNVKLPSGDVIGPPGTVFHIGGNASEYSTSNWRIGGAFHSMNKAPEDAVTMGTYISIAIPEMVACVIGLAYGWCTVTFRTWYEAKVMPAANEAAEELKKSA